MDTLKSFTSKEIFRTSRNIFIVNFILLLIVASFLAGRIDPLYNRLLGPFEIEVKEINNIKESKWLIFNVKKKYFEISVNKINDPKINAEITTITKRRRNSSIESKTIKVSAKYIVGQVDNSLLLITVNPSFEVPAKDSFLSFNGIFTEYPGDLNNLPNYLPFLLDTTEKPSNSPYWWFGFGIPLMTLFLWQIIKSFFYLLYPSFHHSIKALSKSGSTKEIIKKINLETQNKSETKRISKITISKSFLIYSDWFSFFVFEIPQIRWIYGEKYSDTTNGIQLNAIYAKDVFVNPDKLNWDSESLIIWTKSSVDSFTVDVSSIKDAALIVDIIIEKTNQIMIGYNEDLHNYWNIRREEIVSFIESKDSISHCLKQSKLKLNLKTIRTSKQ